MLAEDRACDAWLGFGTYVPDRWVPVRLGLRNDTDIALAGHVEIGDDGQPILSGSGSAAIFRTPVRVPAHSRVTVSTYAYFTEPIKTASRDTSRDTSILARIQWRDEAGGFLARSDFNAPACGGIFVVVGDRVGQDDNSPYSAYALERIPERVTQAKASVVMRSAADLPAEAAGYDAAIAVVLDGQDPEALATAQRQALIDYVRRGGVLLIHAPSQSMRLGASWLADYLPVQIVGWREMSALDVTSDRVYLAGPLKLSRAVETCEAIPAGRGEQIVLRDQSYVHAACMPVGLGRVVFTSFPVASLSTSSTEDAAERIWVELLGVARHSHDWRDGAMFAGVTAQPPKPGGAGQSRQTQLQLMHSMIGWPVPSVRFAMAVGASYVLAAAAIHLLLGANRRPLAYIVITALAVVVWGGVTVAERFGRQGLKLTGGRLVSIDIGPDGTGRQQEAVCYFGARDDRFALSGAAPDVMLRPTLAGRNNPVRLATEPLGAPAAGVVEQTPARLWLADGVAKAPGGLAATVRFGPDGAQLTAANRFGQTIASPLLIAGAQSYRLNDFGAGPSQEALVRRNEPGRFIAGDVLGERAKLREAFIAVVLTRPAGMTERNVVDELQLIGWADHAPELLATTPALQQPPRQEVMVRAPVAIEPAAVGSRVKIDSAFIRLIYASPDATYQLLARGDEVPDGSWSIGFATPSEIGRLGIQRAIIEADLQAPLHAIDIVSRSGQVLAHWSKPVAKETIEFSPTPADVDANGWVWLTVKAQVVGRGAEGLTPKWQLRQLSVSYEGEVVGPPFAPAPLPQVKAAPVAKPGPPPKGKTPARPK